jgi:hypothetical protein
MAANVAREVPGLPGPAKNDAGPMSEKPTKATFRPRRVTTWGRDRRADSRFVAVTTTSSASRAADTLVRRV